MPGDKDPLILARTSEAMYLLQRIRDEAHRFAITFHRSRRSKVMLESLLDEIPQLGETRRASLLDRFGSVTAMRKASAEDLAATPGIGSTIAAIIYDHLQSLSIPAVDMNTGEILDS
jgi:excinuclease ABC subunit C